MDSPPVTIREFRYPADYQQVYQLWGMMERGVRVGRSDTQIEIQKKIARDPELFLVAESAEKIIGTVIGGFDGRRGLLYHLAVAKEFRGHGIGTSLLNEVESRLRAKGCLKCYLMVTPENDEAAQYYQHHGWHLMDYVHPYGKDLQ